MAKEAAMNTRTLFALYTLLLTLWWINDSFAAEVAIARTAEEKAPVFYTLTTQKPTTGTNTEDFLSDYFTDCIAEVVSETESTITFNLSFPNSSEFFVDPDLETGLRFFCGYVPPLHSLAYQFKETDKYIEALNDSWTLLGWSKWFSRNYDSLSEDSTIVIIHFDDHTDFMSPRVSIREEGLFDLITGSRIDLRSPDSIIKAIQSTSIGIGSFFAPFIWEVQSKVKQIKILHVSQRYEALPEFFKLEAEVRHESFPVECERLTLKLTPSEAISDSGVDYVRTSELSNLLPFISEGDRILVHFDLDCFNNRFDRDSDWASKAEIYNPNADAIHSAIKTACESLVSRYGLERLENISIAYCPGFFPAEYWEAAHKILMSYLKGDLP